MSKLGGGCFEACSRIPSPLGQSQTTFTRGVCARLGTRAWEEAPLPSSRPVGPKGLESCKKIQDHPITLKPSQSSPGNRAGKPPACTEEQSMWNRGGGVF